MKELCGESLRLGAAPPAVQVCLICLNTSSKMLSMNEYNSAEAYEHLTGVPLFDVRNLKHTLCVGCTQKLINFENFRNESLKARVMLMKMMEQHEVITHEHISALIGGADGNTGSWARTCSSDSPCELQGRDVAEEATVKTEKSLDMEWDSTETVADEASVKIETLLLMAWGSADNVAEEYSVKAVPSIYMEMNSTDAVSETKRCGANSMMLDWKLLDTTLCSVLLTRVSCVDELAQDLVKLENVQVQCTERDEDAISESIQETTRSPVTTLTTVPNVSLKNDCNVGCGDIVATEDIAHKTISYICDVCQCKFKCKNLLVKHIRSHTKASLLTCNWCPYLCRYNSHLERHIMITHSREKRSFKCTTKTNLVHHRTTHEKKPFHCLVCPYKSARKSHLTRHMKKHSGEKPFLCKLPYTCSVCEYKCGCKASLDAHMRKHTGDTFHCELCQRKFVYSYHLQEHMRSHYDVKPFECKLCSHKFTRKSSLMNHIRIHSGEKPFHCLVCPYKSAQKSHLTRHMKKHSGEKPFLCKLCSYKFAEKVQLVCHMRTHTGERPYTCSVCEYKYAVRRSLIVHIKKHHKK